MATVDLGLGATPEAMAVASSKLGVKFPEELVAIWSVCNGLDLPGGWRFLPVFDPRNPRKTSNDIIYENTPGRGRVDKMDANLVVIASGDIGDCLVLQKKDGSLGREILLWYHDSNETEKSRYTWTRILKVAHIRVETIRRKVTGKRK